MMTNLPTATEVAELIEFCRNEVTHRQSKGVDAYYIAEVSRMAAIAERLPALLAEIENVKRDRDGYFDEAHELKMTWPAWAESMLNMVRAETGNLDTGDIDLPDELRDLISFFHDEIARLMKERADLHSTLFASASARSAANAEIARLTKERDEARAWAERLRSYITAGGWETIESEQEWKRRAESAELESSAANSALQKIGMSLGSSDEWTDQATMIADVSERVARLVKERDDAREANDQLMSTAHGLALDKEAAQSEIERLRNILKRTESAYVIAYEDGTNERLSRENATLREALAAFVSAQQTNDRGEYAGWRISGRGSVNEAVERARAALTQLDAPLAEEAIVLEGNPSLDPKYTALLEEWLGVPDGAGDWQPPIAIDYTNWRGERRTRNIIPLRPFYGSNEWHKEPQWLLEATDPEDGKTKTFAFAGIHGFGEPPAEAPHPAVARALIEEENADG